MELISKCTQPGALIINLCPNLLVSNWSITPWALAATEAATRHDDHTAAAAVTARTENGLPAIITQWTEETRRRGRKCGRATGRTEVSYPLNGTNKESPRSRDLLFHDHLISHKAPPRRMG